MALKSKKKSIHSSACSERFLSNPFKDVKAHAVKKSVTSVRFEPVKI